MGNAIWFCLIGSIANVKSERGEATSYESEQELLEGVKGFNAKGAQPRRRKGEINRRQLRERRRARILPRISGNFAGKTFTEGYKDITEARSRGIRGGVGGRGSRGVGVRRSCNRRVFACGGFGCVRRNR